MKYRHINLATNQRFTPSYAVFDPERKRGVKYFGETTKGKVTAVYKQVGFDSQGKSLLVEVDEPEIKASLKHFYDEPPKRLPRKEFLDKNDWNVQGALDDLVKEGLISP